MARYTVYGLIVTVDVSHTGFDFYCHDCFLDCLIEVLDKILPVFKLEHFDS